MKMTGRMKKIEKFLSKPYMKCFADALTLAVFTFIILLPTIFVFTYVFSEWGEVYSRVFNDPIAGDVRWEAMKSAMALSLLIASSATAIDVAIGLPMAVILARYNFKGKKLVDALVDFPLAIPSSALGFSILLFWATGDGIASLFSRSSGLVGRGPLLILLAHVAFTYSYVVRSLTSVIKGVDVSYEQAGRTLGASSFTVFRTITSPLAKHGLIAGIILAFARSLGETGATLMVAGIYETAPLTVISMHQRLLISSAAFLSVILVAVACTLLLLIRVLSVRVGIPIKKVWPGPERFLSGSTQKRIRDFLAFSSFGILILIPSSFTIPYVVKWWSGSPYTGRFESGVYYQVFVAPDMKWRMLWDSLITSMEIAFIATAVNIILGIPMSTIIVRRRWGKINELLETLIDIPLVIPTSALGFSVYLFWGLKGLKALTPGFWLTVLTHIVFTYPYVVRSISAVLKGLNPSLEDAARTLGATPITTFRTVVLPLLKPGLLSAAVLAFTRSLGETGATIVVMGRIRTIPVLIVQWAEAMALPAAAFACIILMILSYLLLLSLRYIVGGV